MDQIVFDYSDRQLGNGKIGAERGVFSWTNNIVGLCVVGTVFDYSDRQLGNGKIGAERGVFRWTNNIVGL